ncbi:MAG: hypothetical protein ACI9S9_005071, partial [Planctomycetota bacterium]
MIRTQPSRRGLILAAIVTSIGCLSAPLSAQATTPQGLFAADGVTLITTPIPVIAPTAMSSADGPGCVDIVYFEDNGGQTGGRGLYDLVSATGISSLRSSVTAAGRLFSLAVDAGGVVYGIDPVSDNLYLVDINSGALIFLVTLVGTA